MPSRSSTKHQLIESCCGFERLRGLKREPRIDECPQAYLWPIEARRTARIARSRLREVRGNREMGARCFRVAANIVSAFIRINRARHRQLPGWRFLMPAIGVPLAESDAHRARRSKHLGPTTSLSLDILASNICC